MYLYMTSIVVYHDVDKLINCATFIYVLKHLHRSYSRSELFNPEVGIKWPESQKYNFNLNFLYACTSASELFNFEVQNELTCRLSQLEQLEIDIDAILILTCIYGGHIYIYIFHMHVIYCLSCTYVMHAALYKFMKNKQIEITYSNGMETFST